MRDKIIITLALFIIVLGFLSIIADLSARISKLEKAIIKTEIKKQ